VCKSAMASCFLQARSRLGRHRVNAKIVIIIIVTVDMHYYCGIVRQQEHGCDLTQISGQGWGRASHGAGWCSADLALLIMFVGVLSSDGAGKEWIGMFS
jgi:hypothetical protein